MQMVRPLCVTTFSRRGSFGSVRDQTLRQLWAFEIRERRAAVKPALHLVSKSAISGVLPILVNWPWMDSDCSKSVQGTIPISDGKSKESILAWTLWCVSHDWGNLRQEVGEPYWADSIIRQRRIGMISDQKWVDFGRGLWVELCRGDLYSFFVQDLERFVWDGEDPLLHPELEPILELCFSMQNSVRHSRIESDGFSSEWSHDLHSDPSSKNGWYCWKWKSWLLESIKDIIQGFSSAPIHQGLINCSVRVFQHITSWAWYPRILCFMPRWCLEKTSHVQWKESYSHWFLQGTVVHLSEVLWFHGMEKNYTMCAWCRSENMPMMTRGWVWSKETSTFKMLIVKRQTAFCQDCFVSCGPNASLAVKKRKAALCGFC